MVRREDQSLADWTDSQEGRALNPPARHEQVAARIARAIRAGRFRPGDRLPAERRLADQLGVGRASVREAIASLQLQGVIETRQGAGSFVVEDAVEQLRTVPAWRSDGEASPSALLDARGLLEPQVAALAAARASSDPIAERLLEQMEGAGDPSDPRQRLAWSEADRLFHRQIAVATGNDLLIGFADQVAATMDQPLWKQLRDESIAVPGRTRLHMAEHRMIHEAIATGDAEAAEFYVRAHLDRVRRYMGLT